MEEDQLVQRTGDGDVELPVVLAVLELPIVLAVNKAFHEIPEDVANELGGLVVEVERRVVLVDPEGGEFVAESHILGNLADLLAVESVGGIVRTAGGIGAAYGGDVERHHVSVAHHGLHLLQVAAHEAHTIGLEEEVLHHPQRFRTVHIALVADIGVVQQEVGLLEHHLVDVCVGTNGHILQTEVEAGVDGDHIGHALHQLISPVVSEREVITAAQDNRNNLVLHKMRHYLGNGGIGVLHGVPEAQVTQVENPHRTTPGEELVELPTDLIGRKRARGVTEGVAHLRHPKDGYVGLADIER